MARTHEIGSKGLEDGEGTIKIRGQSARLVVSFARWVKNGLINTSTPTCRSVLRIWVSLLQSLILGDKVGLDAFLNDSEDLILGRSFGSGGAWLRPPEVPAGVAATQCLFCQSLGGLLFQSLDWLLRQSLGWLLHFCRS
jgi:hypothetical protein